MKIGGLSNGTYFVYHTTPGVHRFTAATEAEAEKILKLEAGEAYYVRGEVKWGAVVGRPHLLGVTKEEGAAAISKLRRVTLHEE